MNQQITPLENTPLNRLFVAINHYISTGDHVGEGMSIPEGPQRHTKGEPHPDDKIRILIPVNLRNIVDVNDLKALRSRFDQIADQFSTKLQPITSDVAGFDSRGIPPGMAIWTFVIQYGQAEELAQALTEQPGPAGWGSMKDLIDQHFPG